MESEELYHVVSVDSNGARIPPILIKGALARDANEASDPVLLFSGTRLFQGQQQATVDIRITSEHVQNTRQRGTESQRTSNTDAFDRAWGYFRDQAYKVDTRQKGVVKVRFDSLPRLTFELDFNHERHPHATPAFDLALEGARHLSNALESVKTELATAQTQLHDKEKELRALDRKLQNTEAELRETSTKLQRLLSTGGNALNDLASAARPGLGKKRTRSAVMEDATQGTARKRKVADPNIARTGRTAQKHATTGFVDDDEEVSDGTEEDELPLAATKSPKRASRATRAAETGRHAASSELSDRANEMQSRATTTRLATAEDSRPGRTVQKKVDTGFVDDDDDEKTASD